MVIFQTLKLRSNHCGKFPACHGQLQMTSSPLHRLAASGPWDIERIEAAFADRMLRSGRRLVEPEGESVPESADDEPWVELLLQFGDTRFLKVRRNWVNAYASSPAEARDLIGRLEGFQVANPTAKASFQLIKYSSQVLDTQRVPLVHQEPMNDEMLGLYYGEEFPVWHAELVRLLRQHLNGISLFEGPPGTGKTSYIRQLMIALKDSHRFYFLPSCNLAALRDSDFVDFWSDERRLHGERRFVVVLEDSEKVLTPRSSDNREEVGVLLNITDGILGEFLRLQVICTVNAQLHELDPALLRPGRLTVRRHFGRLPRDRALRLAERLGRKLPNQVDDFSLAEIVNETVDDTTRERPAIGFRPAG